LVRRLSLGVGGQQSNINTTRFEILFRNVRTRTFPNAGRQKSSECGLRHCRPRVGLAGLSFIGCRDGTVIVELCRNQRIVGSRTQRRRLLEQSIRLGGGALMTDLGGELHHRERECWIVGSENALLNSQRLTKGLLGGGRIVDRIVGIARCGEVIEALEVAAAEASMSGAAGNEPGGVGRWCCPAGYRPPAESTQGCFECREREGGGIGAEYPTADGARHCQMRPPPGPPGALQQNRGNAVKNPRRGRRATGKTLVQISAPRPGHRQIIEPRGRGVAQIKDSSARLPPIPAVQIHLASGADTGVAGGRGLEMAGLADLVFTRSDDRDRRCRLRARNIGARWRGFATRARHREDGAEEQPFQRCSWHRSLPG